MPLVILQAKFNKILAHDKRNITKQKKKYGMSDSTNNEV